MTLSPDLLSVPRVTVFVPVFNAEQFLSETISSILAQTFVNFELLVIDDGSTDHSLSILESFNDPRIRIFKNEMNRGRPFTRNRGLELARAEYVAVLDADDVAEPERLAKQVEFLDQHPEITAVGSAAKYIDDKGKIAFVCKVPTDSEEIHKHIFQSNCFVHSSIMFRQQSVLDIGGYNLSLPQAQDYDLFLRLSESHQLANIPEPLIRYRVHSNQVSQRKLASQRRLADQARYAAFIRHMALGTLPKDVLEPRSSIFDRLRGNKATLGDDYLGWIYLYRQLGRHEDAARLLWPALLAAPLSRKVHTESYRCLMRRLSESLPFIRAVRWYFSRFFKLFRN